MTALSTMVLTPGIAAADDYAGQKYSDVTSALADSDGHVIPGHDPAVMKQYPAFDAAVPDIFMLHRPPRLAARPDSMGPRAPAARRCAR